jgi:hypothetical protein
LLLKHTFPFHPVVEPEEQATPQEPGMGIPTEDATGHRAHAVKEQTWVAVRETETAPISDG